MRLKGEIMVGEEILSKMDKTLDQLMINAEALQLSSHFEISDFEIEAMQKIQQSLLSHLIYLDKDLEEKAKKSRRLHNHSARKHIYLKLQKYQKLNGEIIQSISKRWEPPRKKRKLQRS